MAEEEAKTEPKPAHAEFVHLRIHTAYSLLEGAVKVKKLVSLCEKYRMPAAAMTDSGNMFGAFEMSQECADHGIQPIIGSQTAGLTTAVSLRPKT